MNREIHNLVQGSAEWLAYRAIPKQFNASDAPAMLGESPYKSRDDLLREMATGLRPDIDQRTQELFDAGHRYEQQDRPLAEELIGQELFPSTVSVEFDGLRLSASLDGWTMDEEIIYEHKTLNKAIRAACVSGEIPLVYRIQLEQQLICSGAIKGLFRGSLGTESTEEPVTLWYESDSALRDRVINGWKQFSIDLDNYSGEKSESAKPVGETIKDLPALIVEIEGAVKSSNLTIYKNHALSFIRSVNTDLQTDQDFANAENVVKFCERVEGELVITKKQILTQAISVNDVLATIDAISAEHRETRLKLEKLIKSEKESRKLDILNKAVAEWNNRLNNLNEKLKIMGGVLLPSIAIDIAGAMKGKRTIDTLRSAANDEVMRATITANTTRIAIEKNLAIINTIGAKHLFLFADKQQLVVKDSEALEAICKQRIAEHDAAEKKRIDDAAEVLANEKIRKQKEVDDAAQAALDKRESDRVAAEEFNQQQAAKQVEPEQPAQEPVTIEPKVIYGGGGSSRGAIPQQQQSSFLEPVAVKALTTIEQVQRDFETVNGLAPALAAIITKSIFDGQHKCLQIKDA
jgi:putative phage-type endonuclease